MFEAILNDIVNFFLHGLFCCLHGARVFRKSEDAPAETSSVGAWLHIL